MSNNAMEGATIDRIVKGPYNITILEMLSQGAPQKEIAGVLGLMESSVYTYIYRMRRYTKARSTTQLVAMAIRNGVIS